MLTRSHIAEQLSAASRADKTPSNEEFHKLVEDMCLAFGVTDGDLAKITGASRPTVQRWRAGTGAPARASRKGMIKLMAAYAPSLSPSSKFGPRFTSTL